MSASLVGSEMCIRDRMTRTLLKFTNVPGGVARALRYCTSQRGQLNGHPGIAICLGQRSSRPINPHCGDRQTMNSSK
eukprot:4093455-Alexandrium_andersonii.AAC.1